jgi:succinoglycan biosynthesis protein ExoO
MVDGILVGAGARQKARRIDVNMSTSPLVSVIMANFNGARYLRAAIDSLRKQTMSDWELIFVDDASTDGSVPIAQAAANADPRVTITAQRENRGPGAARNAALEMARGEWIAIFDSDDMMAPQRLETLLNRAARDQAAIVADNLLLFSDTAQKPRPHLRNALGVSPHWISLADLIESDCLYSRTPNLGYLKPMIKANLIGQFRVRYDEQLRIGEDSYFLASLLANGQRLRFEPTPLYHYRKHPSSISHRMKADHIYALMDADDRFRKQVPLNDRETRLLDRRRQSLDALLDYDRVVHAIKQGEPGRGAGLAMRNPRIWPLLTRPIAARLKRMREALEAL